MNWSKNARLSCLMLLAVSLSACNKYGEASRFCERENRTIMDANLKGKLLLEIWKIGESGRNKKYNRYQLPIHMKNYLQERASSSLSHLDIVNILTEYVSRYPNCCEFTYEFEMFKKQWRDTGEKPGVIDSEYFANLTVYENPSPDFRILMGQRSEGGPSMKRPIKLIVAASNCGDHVAPFDHG